MISVFRGRNLPNIKCWALLDRPYKDTSFPCKAKDMNRVICTNDPQPWHNGRLVEVAIPPDAVVVANYFAIDSDSKTNLPNQNTTCFVIWVEKYDRLDNYLGCEIINQSCNRINYVDDFTIENVKAYHGKTFRASFTDDFPFTTERYDVITEKNKYYIYPVDYQFNPVGITDVYEVCIPDDALVISGGFMKSRGLVVSCFDIIRRLENEELSKIPK